MSRRDFESQEDGYAHLRWVHECESVETFVTMFGKMPPLHFLEEDHEWHHEVQLGEPHFRWVHEND